MGLGAAVQAAEGWEKKQLLLGRLCNADHPWKGMPASAMALAAAVWASEGRRRMWWLWRLRSSRRCLLKRMQASAGLLETAGQRTSK
jgi:hypothetical protein